MVLEFVEAALEEAAGWFLLRKGEGALVGGVGFRDFAEAAAEVGAGGMCEVVVEEIAAIEDGVDEGEACGGIVGRGRRIWAQSVAAALDASAWTAAMAAWSVKAPKRRDDRACCTSARPSAI